MQQLQLECHTKATSVKSRELTLPQCHNMGKTLGSDDGKCSLVCCIQTVEAAAASGKFVYKADLDAAEQPVPSIQGYAVILPTILSVMYGQGEWPEEYTSVRYGDHSAWDRPTILEMLQQFFTTTQAISLPDLTEYEWRSDKVHST